MATDPDVQGDPEAVYCRWCEAGRMRLRGHYFCALCDSGQVGGITVAPTWMGDSKK